MDRPPLPEFGFMRMWTRRTQWVIGALAVAYVAQLATQPLFESLLELHPLGAGFAPWQPLTYTFVQSTPAFTLLGWFVILNFLETTIRSLGERRFWMGTLVVWATASFATGLLGLTSWFGATPVATPSWWIEAMVVWFAFSNRGATINLMMVLPLKAENMAWLSGLLNVLGVAYYRDLSSVHMLLAWVAAYAVYFGPGFFQARGNSRPRAPRGPGLQVLEGGKLGDRPRRNRPDEYIN